MINIKKKKKNQSKNETNRSRRPSMVPFSCSSSSSFFFIFLRHAKPSPAHSPSSMQSNELKFAEMNNINCESPSRPLGGAYEDWKGMRRRRRQRPPVHAVWAGRAHF